MKGIFDQRTGQMNLDDCDISVYEDAAFLVAYMGKPESGTGASFDFLPNLIADGSLDCSEYFQGPFLLLVYAKKEEQLTVTQHPFGSPCSFYFDRGGDEGDVIRFATSLAEMRMLTGTSFRMNRTMVPEFFDHGYLLHSHTLIVGLERLPVECSLTADRTGVRFSKISWYGNATEPDGDLKSLYRKVMDTSIGACMGDDKEISMALSGGFDSNCILYHVKERKPDIPVHAYSVGGKREDETGIAKEIAGMYPNISITCGHISGNTLDALDDIVHRLEGCLYERGIFLQYELANLLAQNHCPAILAGECADQVFHRMTYERDPEWLASNNDPYLYAANIILRKSIFMLRSFGIEGRYPFLNSAVLRLGYLTRQENGLTKEFHKQLCREILPDRVAGMLNKVGGSTDNTFLFGEDFDYSEAIRKSRFYGPAIKIKEKMNMIDYAASLKQAAHGKKFKADVAHKKRNVQDVLCNQYLSLRYLESFEKQFCG